TDLQALGGVVALLIGHVIMRELDIGNIGHREGNRARRLCATGLRLSRRRWGRAGRGGTGRGGVGTCAGSRSPTASTQNQRRQQNDRDPSKHPLSSSTP